MPLQIKISTTLQHPPAPLPCYSFCDDSTVEATSKREGSQSATTPYVSLRTGQVVVFQEYSVSGKFILFYSTRKIT